jgi:pyruvate/2-oxoglutarate/acetoin dehydrogenase E1 component
VVASVVERCHDALRAPVVRVGTLPIPTPSGKVRPFALPTTERIVEAVRRLVQM